MRALTCVLVASLLLAFVPDPLPADAAERAAPSAPRSRTFASVGERLDAPRLPVTRHGPGAQPYRPIDQAAFGLAKADAARRAAGGVSPLRRNDFAITASPASRTVTQGSSATYLVMTSVTSGNTRPVALSVSGLPAGVTGSFDPASVNAGGTSVLTVTASATAAPGTVGLVISGAYSAPPVVHTTAVSLTVVANDFSIGVLPSTASVVQGSSVTYTVATSVTSGDPQSVSLSITGLPAGATGTFVPSTVTSGQSATLTVATTSSAATGTSTFTVTGTGSSATHTAGASLTVAPLVIDDFSIGISPLTATVVQGSSATYTVNTSVLSGNAQNVGLSVSGLPAGATGSFVPSTVTSGGSAMLTVATTPGTTLGTSTFTVTGTSSTAMHAATASLTVNAPVVDDFAITLSPLSASVVQGSSVTYTVATTVLSGNAQSVSLSIGGLPAGATGTFVPSSVTSGQSATLTVATDTSTPAGTSTFTVTGTGSSATHTAGGSLTVTPLVVDDFSIAVSPASATVVQGASSTYTVATSVASGNPQSVSLSISGLPAGASGTFVPSTVTSGQSATLTVTTTTSTPVGTSAFTVTGTSSTATHSASASLTVDPLVVDDFSIGVSPSTAAVGQGSTVSYSVTTSVVSGNPQSVSLAVGGLPAGATGTFFPSIVTSGGSATLTVATSASTPTGTTTFTVTGTSATATHSASASLTVNPRIVPTVGVSWEGQFQSDVAPPDPTGAVGPSSFIQLINLRYGIYDRRGGLIQQGDLGELTRFPVGELSDPQIVWDPYSGRYYYLVLDVFTSAYAFGYSKTSDPHDAVADFCHYQVGALYSSLVLPDYPKLAVTPDFVLVGTNVFLLLTFYQGSDIDWWVKPTDAVCPGSLGAGGKFEAVRNVDGSLMSTPVPAVAADRSSGGWVVGTSDVSSTGPASFVTVYKVNRNSQGLASLAGPWAVGVEQYAMPANAPQSGTAFKLDTFDTRFTHAMAAFDPRIGSTALWTNHAVFGGAGSEARWYEIAALATPTLAQSGKVTHTDLYVFNGAVSPDRAADDAGNLTGANMVIGFNTSSSTTFSTLQVASKRGAGAQSDWVLVQRSPGPNVDFSCGSGAVPDVCRWGDYGGAKPDPLVSSGGQVWLSGEWNLAATDGTTAVWRTWNWSALP